MEFALPFACTSDNDEDDDCFDRRGAGRHASSTGGRAVCDRCHRPMPQACVCEALPSPPIALAEGSRVIVLRHPRERKRRLATVPLLQLGLQDACIDVLDGRRFPLNAEPNASLAAAVDAARAENLRMLVLYPGPGARDLAALAASHARDGGVPYCLVAIDGTWQEAREMWHANRDVLIGDAPSAFRCRVGFECAPPAMHDGGGGAAAAAAGDNASQFPGGAFKAEPNAQGCTTLEAVAHALGVLEGDDEVASALVRPLARLTALQASHDPALRARLRCNGGVGNGVRAAARSHRARLSPT